MLRTILVGVDPTEYSTAAVDLGVRWAQQFDAMLVGIGVVDRPGICRADVMPVELELLQSRAMRRSHPRPPRESTNVLVNLRYDADARVACKVLEDVGDPFDQIAIEAQRYDLIMVGQETHFRFETTASADDTLNKLLKLSPRPVVVAPSVAPEKENEGILFCCDGSAKASRALKSFVDIGFSKDRPVTVLSIDQNRLYAAKNADRAVDFLSFHGIKANALPIESYLFPSEIILQQAKIQEVGLIVMGAP